LQIKRHVVLHELISSPLLGLIFGDSYKRLWCNTLNENDFDSILYATHNALQSPVVEHVNIFFSLFGLGGDNYNKCIVFEKTRLENCLSRRRNCVSTSSCCQRSEAQEASRPAPSLDSMARWLCLQIKLGM